MGFGLTGNAAWQSPVRQGWATPQKDVIGALIWSGPVWTRPMHEPSLPAAMLKTPMRYIAIDTL
jgi:hypothetical protein